MHARVWDGRCASGNTAMCVVPCGIRCLGERDGTVSRNERNRQNRLRSAITRPPFSAQLRMYLRIHVYYVIQVHRLQKTPFIFSFFFLWWFFLFSFFVLPCATTGGGRGQQRSAKAALGNVSSRWPCRPPVSPPPPWYIY